MNLALRRVIDLQYRLYDRARHPRAEQIAATPGRAGPFDELGDAGYCLLVTFKRDGTAVPTPVVFARAGDGNAYVRSEPRAWKVRRVRNDPHVRIARCNARGKPRGPLYEGRARVLAAEEAEHARRILWESYSRPIKLYEGTVDRLPVGLVYLCVEPVPA